MRKTGIITVLAAALWAGSASHAQVMTNVGGASPAVAGSGGVSYYSSFYGPGGTTGLVADPVPPGYIPPYSYYVAPPGVPARPYVGYGETDLFPFHGQPYGYPYDRWTWSGMSGSPPRSLVRYFYPPVP